MVEFAGKTVGHYTDNVATVYIMGSGSRQPKLQALDLDIFMSLRKFNITLVPVWITRDSAIIQWADSGSKDFHSDDYQFLFSLWRLDLVNSVWTVLHPHQTRFVRNVSHIIFHQEVLG